MVRNCAPENPEVTATRFRVPAASRRSRRVQAAAIGFVLSLGVTAYGLYVCTAIP
jgi:hypothetical protein